MVKKAGKWVGNRVGSLDKGIRVKSSLKGTGKFAGKIAENDIVQGLALAALTASGVGAPAAAAILAASEAGGKLAQGKNIGEALKAGVKTGVTSYGVGKLGSAVKMLPGAGKVGSALSKLPGAGKVTAGINAVRSMPGASQALSMGNAVKMGIPGQASSQAGTPAVTGGAPESGGGSWWQNIVRGGGSDDQGQWGMLGDLLGGGGADDKGSFGRLGDFLGNHGDTLAMGGAVAANYLENKANRELRERAMKYAEDSFNARAPLRTAGMAGALNPERPDLTAIAANPGNPYARSGRIG